MLFHMLIETLTFPYHRQIHPHLCIDKFCSPTPIYLEEPSSSCVSSWWLWWCCCFFGTTCSSSSSKDKMGMTPLFSSVSFLVCFVFNDWYNVGLLFGHPQQVPSEPMGKFHSIDIPLGTYDIAGVKYNCIGHGTQV